MIIYPLSKIYSDNLKHPYPVSGAGAGGGEKLPNLPYPYKAMHYIDCANEIITIGWTTRAIEHLKGDFSGMGDDNSTLLKVDSFDDWFYLGFTNSICTFKTDSSVTDTNISIDQKFSFEYTHTTGNDAECSFNGITQSIPKITTSAGSAGFNIGDCNSVMRCYSPLYIDLGSGDMELYACKDTSTDTLGIYCIQTSQFFPLTECSIN